MKGQTMRTLHLSVSAAVLLGIGLIAWWHPAAWWAMTFVVPVIGLGVRDMLQENHTILRDYPLFEAYSLFI